MDSEYKYEDIDICIIEECCMKSLAEKGDLNIDEQDEQDYHVCEKCNRVHVIYKDNSFFVSLERKIKSIEKISKCDKTFCSENIINR